ncbi:MAG TPA: alpha/beta fold hydrolase [Oligoflexus sp.]|uniref:alpha/beta fold hydrolase n=1 Tax=Oligoflexus sp. TaxID=1971216 RepID=UPI002D5B7FB5|nr:alpha/beta fold hydrolase [Oligoflexus sp.]HYX38642.1 alpha/beta fold hydrolase [Oligoflexus sp.]
MRAFPRWLWPWISWVGLSLPAQAVPEHMFDQEFESRILPEFWSTGSSAFFTAPDGVKIHYRQYVKPGQDRALVILPGRTESTFKYAEFLYDIQDLNLAVFILDHRGQGASGREIPDQPQMQYVRDFQDYRNDLGQLLTDVIAPFGFKGIQALGHSMGANILALYMVEHPDAIQKAVISSPMLDINPSPFPAQWMAHWVGKIACWLGFDKRFVPGHGPFRYHEEYRGTGSPVRYRAFNKLRAERKDELVGGVSFGFGLRALEATYEMRDHAAKLLVPILMFQAGNDEVVLTGGQDHVCQLAKQCRKLVFPEARHELHIESDGIRDSWLREIRQFISAP